MTWPVAELDSVGRLRALAAAYRSAGVAEVTVDLPVDEAWEWVTDFERNVPRFDADVSRVRIRRRDGNRIRLWAWTRRMPVPLAFDVFVEPGFCVMRGTFRLYLVVMAAVPTPDGGTRYVHAEAVPRRGFGWVRRLVQRAVDGDVVGFARLVGT